jgi:ChrB-like protein
LNRPRPVRKPALLLGYQLPAEPTRYRVSIWRDLRRIGAIPLHRALFIIVDTPLNRLRAADMVHDIENWGGHAWVFVGTPLAGSLPSAAPERVGGPMSRARIPAERRDVGRGRSR